MFGNEDNELQLSNIEIILLTLIVFHTEISCNFFRLSHDLNNPLILITLLVFHFEISGISSNDEHPSKAE